MSGIFLVLEQGGAADPAVVGRMSCALAHRGPDGCDILTRPGLALGHLHFWTTPEEIGERQPIAGTEGRFWLAFDGRIDNRPDLVRALDRDDSDSRHLSDAALVALAFERWDEGCFERLLGPFAVAVVEPDSRRVVLARDALGDRTLCFHRGVRRLIVASEECAVIEHPAVSRALDETRLATLFAVAEPADGRTFFAEVEELLPAHVLTVNGDGTTRLSQHWSPDPDAARGLRHEDEVVDRFRELLDESVACRLRAVGRPAVLLSGGLDSAPMTALAASRVAPGRLLSVSWVFDELAACDERTYIDEVRKRYDLDAIEVVSDSGWPLRDLESWPLNPNTPEETPYRWLPERAYRAARDSGATVALAGTCGDDLYSCGSRWLLDLLREG